MKPEEGYEYELDMTSGRWTCKKGSRFVHDNRRELILVRTPEEGGFTVYYATDVRFSVEDGVPMWKTMEEDVLEPGWHRWFYHICRDQGRTWASWDESACFFKTTVIRWKKVSIPCAGGGCYTRWSTRGSGGSKHMRRSGASGGSGAGIKWRQYWTWPNGTHGSRGKRRSHASGHAGSWKGSGKGRIRGW